MQKINTITFNRKDLSAISCSYDPTFEEYGDYRAEAAKWIFEKTRETEKDGILPKAKEAN